MEPVSVIQFGHININNENQNTTPRGKKSLTAPNTTNRSAVSTELWTDIITT